MSRAKLWCLGALALCLAACDPEFGFGTASGAPGDIVSIDASAVVPAPYSGGSLWAYWSLPDEIEFLGCYPSGDLASPGQQPQVTLGGPPGTWHYRAWTAGRLFTCRLRISDDAPPGEYEISVVDAYLDSYPSSGNLFEIEQLHSGTVTVQ